MNLICEGCQIQSICLGELYNPEGCERLEEAERRHEAKVDEKAERKAEDEGKG